MKSFKSIDFHLLLQTQLLRELNLIFTFPFCTRFQHYTIFYNSNNFLINLKGIVKFCKIKLKETISVISSDPPWKDDFYIYNCTLNSFVGSQILFFLNRKLFRKVSLFSLKSILRQEAKTMRNFVKKIRQFREKVF